MPGTMEAHRRTQRTVEHDVVPPASERDPETEYAQQRLGRHTALAMWPFVSSTANNQLVCKQKKLVSLLDLCVSSLRKGHANLLCIVPILTDDPRKAPNVHE